MDIFHVKEYFLSLSQGQRSHFSSSFSSFLQRMLHRRDCSLCNDISKATCAPRRCRNVWTIWSVAARSQGMNRCPGHASSVNIIHWRVGASVRHICSVYKFISAEWEWRHLLYNLTVIPVAWGSYYRNVICIARSVGVGGNWAICYLKGCNMSRLCLDEYFSLFCIWHYCNFHSKS